MYRHADLPCLPIKFNLSFFILILVGTVSASAFLPVHAVAFWPFSTNADAARGAFVPNSSTPTLQASTNIDPNPDKGLDSIQTSGNSLLADAGPFGTIANVVGTTPPDRISVYVVRPGDTLSEIAYMFNVSVNTIVWANNLTSAKLAHPGDTLIILPVSGVEHIIAKGDTLNSIAKKYGADANEVAQYNGLDSEATLVVGSMVIIPGGEIAAQVSVPRRSQSSPIIVGGGSFQTGYYDNPVPGGLITQGIHGWNGIDIGAARGTPIYAAHDGTVIIARGSGWNGGYGNYVVITHSNGTQTLYSHMKNVIVSPGQVVAGNQVIGYVGASGRATGAHLHFEVRGAANPLRNCSVGSVCAPQ
jgi:murein DD-endopeptidase MepM/ murein hydrolase activator NlpD